jgi:2,4-dienoyl-CoA reductase-like NADH-dependent reductase (Old Yellow Enzyme family)
VQLHHGGLSGYGYSDGGKQSKFSLNDAPREILEKTIASFGKAAARVKKAGFDAVAVHAAHGYLISQFLTPVSEAPPAERMASGSPLEGGTRLPRFSEPQTTSSP